MGGGLGDQMMAQYSRQVNMDMENTEDRALSPTCEVISNEAGYGGSNSGQNENLKLVRIIRTAKYGIMSTSLWSGRSRAEKGMIVSICILLLILCTFSINLLIPKQV